MNHPDSRLEVQFFEEGRIYHPKMKRITDLNTKKGTPFLFEIKREEVADFVALAGFEVIQLRPFEDIFDELKLGPALFTSKGVDVTLSFFVTLGPN